MKIDFRSAIRYEAIFQNAWTHAIRRTDAAAFVATDATRQKRRFILASRRPQQIALAMRHSDSARGRKRSNAAYGIEKRTAQNASFLRACTIAGVFVRTVVCTQLLIVHVESLLVSTAVQHARTAQSHEARKREAGCQRDTRHRRTGGKEISRPEPHREPRSGNYRCLTAAGKDRLP